MRQLTSFLDFLNRRTLIDKVFQGGKGIWLSMPLYYDTDHRGTSGQLWQAHELKTFGSRT